MSKSHAVTVATLAALRTDPATFHVAATTPGLAGVLVLYSAPTSRPTPSALRTAFADALDRAGASGHGASAFLGSLPDTVTPVAALGIAVRTAKDDGYTWHHNRTIDGSSRWTYCASSVTADAVSIHGANRCAEASKDGRLDVDADVPLHVAVALRAAYDAARGVVEPSRVVALVAAYLGRPTTRCGGCPALTSAGIAPLCAICGGSRLAPGLVAGQDGRAITSDVYLMPETSPTTCGVLAGLADVGGWAQTVAVADPKRIALLSSPVTKSIEEQIADVVKATEEFIARAASVTSGATVTTIGKDGKSKTGPATIREGTGETIRTSIADARAAASLWRDRLGLASLDVDAMLGKLTVEAQSADDAALAAIAKRREERKLAKEAAALLPGGFAVDVTADA